MHEDSKLKDVNYYYITDESVDVPIEEQVKTALNSGVRMIQYRKKRGSDREIYLEAMSLKKLCGDMGLFIVNDHVDIALAVDADGVHIGQDDLPAPVTRSLIGDRILGISTHSTSQALEAERWADYVGLGPVHHTSTKDSVVSELGIEEVVKIAKEVDAPTAAIGGITKDDIGRLLEGVDMICAISEVTRKGDLGSNIRYFEEEIRKIKEGDPVD